MTRLPGGRTEALVEVLSYEGQWMGLPQSPYTLMWRIENYLAAVLVADPTAREIGA